MGPGGGRHEWWCVEGGFQMAGLCGCMLVGTLSITLAYMTVGFQVGRMVRKTSCTTERNSSGLPARKLDFPRARKHLSSPSENNACAMACNRAIA
jgi:hypothetical protein